MAKKPSFFTNDKILQENTVLVIIINNEKIREFAETKFLNCKTIDYVKEAVEGFEIREVFVNDDIFLNSLLSPEILLFDYVFLTQANLPLLIAETVKASLDYFKITGAAICKLPAGHIINSAEYKKLGGNEKSEVMPNFLPEESFLQFKSYADYNRIFEILKSRVILKHIKNGVNIIDIQNVYIDKTVQIQSGATVYPFCFLSGNCKILSNEVLKPFSEKYD